MAFSITDPSTWGLGNIDYAELLSGIIPAIGALDGTSDQTVKPYMVAGQEAGFKQAIADAKAQYAQGPQSYYPGQTVAGLDQATIDGQNQQLSTTQRLQDMANRSGRGALSLSEGGAAPIGGFQLEDQIGFGIPQEYQSAIMDPIMRELNNNIIPGIHTGAQAQGAFGGSRMQQQKSDAAEQATKAATDAMIMGNLQARQQSIGQRAGDIGAQLTGRAQDISQNQVTNNAMATGSQLMNEAMAQQLLPGQVMQSVGNQRTLYDQSLIDADKTRFDWNRQESNDVLNRLMAQLNLTPNGGTVTQGQSGGPMDALLAFMQGTNMYNTARGTGTSSQLQPVTPQGVRIPTTPTSPN